MNRWASLAVATGAIRVMQVAMPWVTARHVRNVRTNVRTRVEEGRIPVVAATGVFTEHATTGSLSEFALCGAPVDSWGGGIDRVECRLCLLAYPEEARRADDRRRADREATRNLDADADGTWDR